MHENSYLGRVRSWARGIKRDVVALWLAARDPRVRWAPKVLAAGVAAYALSPIDLVPDFIPVLGYLDDLLIVPLGIWAVVKLIPPELMAEFRQAAADKQRPQSRGAAIVIVVVWLVCAALLARFAWARLR